jgi:hypothetical protein
VATGNGEAVRASAGASAAGVEVLGTELTAGLEEKEPFSGAQAASRPAIRTRLGKMWILVIYLLLNVVYTSLLTQIPYQIINDRSGGIGCLLFD